LGTVTIQVNPGPVTQIASSNVYFKGDIAQAPEAAEQRETILTSSAKATGLAFTQPTWDRVKSGALREVTAQRYPRGRIANSLADIDTSTQSAHLHVEIESGPPVQIGDIRVEGAERYDAINIERMARLAGLTPGSDYNLEKLQAAQQRVADSGYYGSVFAYVDLDSGEGAAPVVVQVQENLKQKLTLGLGGSTDNGPRLSAEHSNLRVPGLGWRAQSKIQYERNDQLLSTDWSAPLGADGWRWGTGARPRASWTTSPPPRASASRWASHRKHPTWIAPGLCSTTGPWPRIRCCDWPKERMPKRRFRPMWGGRGAALTACLFPTAATG
jgi:translocation and assembly module TamA